MPRASTRGEAAPVALPWALWRARGVVADVAASSRPEPQVFLDGIKTARTQRARIVLAMLLIYGAWAVLAWVCFACAPPA